MTSTETTKRHQSFDFIKQNEGKPGDRSMRTLPDDRLKAVTEEYEQKACLIPESDTRAIVEHLARVGREEMELRAREAGPEERRWLAEMDERETEQAKRDAAREERKRQRAEWNRSLLFDD